MGKSTTAQMFRDMGVPVWDADATVHRLYDVGGAAIDPLSRLVPGCAVEGRIDRTVLKQAIAKDPDLLSQIEAIVHPLVAEDRMAFLSAHASAPLVVLDIPLLFETGGDAHVDGTLVVTTDADTQRARVMARPGMTEDTFRDLLSRQMSDLEKRAKADYVIRSDTLDNTRQEVAALIERLKDTPDA